MTFVTYLQRSADQIEKESSRFFSQYKLQLQKTNPLLPKLLDYFINAHKGGKRLRGALLQLGFEFVRGQSFANILKPALAIEVFQTAILAHDDIIDLSPTRRGKPTIYHALGADHHALSQTICLADLGLFLATKLIADSDFPDKEKNKSLSLFSQMALSTVIGESLDVELPYKAKDFTEQDVLSIYTLKTAYYTFVYPLGIGATLAGAEGSLLKIIKTFGLNLGIAFQIQDDILGIFGDEKITGKSITSDAEEGKVTILLVKALENASSTQLQIIKKLYGKKQLTIAELEKIKKVFIDTKAVEYANDKASQYIESAQKIIPQMTQNSTYQKLLFEMTRLLINRQK